jgi:hypothetical protein
MHLVSNVEGTLRPDKRAIDLFLSAFPAGTLSGAPKIRAMELIDELEPSRRGPYGGAVAYFGFSGSLDSCIAIRTVVLKSDQAYIQAGAGIVYDSVAETEYEETLSKSAALKRAIELAKERLDGHEAVISTSEARRDPLLRSGEREEQGDSSSRAPQSDGEMTAARRNDSREGTSS